MPSQVVHAPHVIARTPKWMVIVMALTSRSSWHKSRRVEGDLKRWHRATERLNSMRVVSSRDDDDPATLWCKVLDRESTDTQPYDRAREPSNS